MVSLRCPRCGGISLDFARFCTVCGLRFDDEPASSERQQTPSPHDVLSKKGRWLILGVVALGLSIGLIAVAVAELAPDSSRDGFPDDYIGHPFPSVGVDRDQDNWTLTIAFSQEMNETTTTRIQDLDNIFLVIVSPDGDVTFSPTSLGSMEPGIYYDGVRFYNTEDLGILDSGDYLTLDSRIFEQGSHVSLMWFIASGSGITGFSLY